MASWEPYGPPLRPSAKFWLALTFLSSSLVGCALLMWKGGL